MYRIGELVETWILPEHVGNGRWVIAIIVRERKEKYLTDVLRPDGVSTSWIGVVKYVGEERD